MHFKTQINSVNPAQTIKFLQEAFEGVVVKTQAKQGIDYMYLHEDKKMAVIIRPTTQKTSSIVLIKYTSDEQKEYLNAIKVADNYNVAYRYKDEEYGWNVRQTGFVDNQGTYFVLELSTI